VLFIPDDDDSQKKKQNSGRQRKGNRKYRLGSQGLEDVEYEDEEDDVSNTEEEEGSEIDGLDRTRRARDRETEPDEDAGGFLQDSEEDISDPGDAEQEDDFNTVQICELHSKTPFVLFRGKYYKCQWHSNIGTELLFTKHDPDDPNPLPSLRTLTGDVDLLAASSLRIMSREVLLTPKETKVEKPRRSRLKVKDLAIDVGKGASAKRKKQAKFLEEFIKIKLELGELDGVTVHAVPRKSVWKWNDLVKEENMQEIQDLKKVVAKGGKGAEEATKKIQEIEAEMQRRQDTIDGGKKKGGPAAGKPRGVMGGKPRRGRPAFATKLSQVVPETLVTATPASGMRSMATSSRGDIDSDEMEDSEDNGEGDSEEDQTGDEDSGQGDSGEENSDEEGSEEGNTDGNKGSPGSEDDEWSDEDDQNEDTTMYD
jgi:hypothetical protein